MDNTSVGNDSLISKEEEKVAGILKERYLEQKNNTAPEVHPQNTVYTRWGKRLVDLIITIPVFTLLLPVNLILGLIVFLDVGRPIFYRQTRVGLNGKHFTMFKFRSMNEKTDADGRLLPASERVTRFGKIMRKLSLDELLNLWFVLKGDMSIIGPRPQPVFIYERMCERHKMRTAIRPGLECPRVIHTENEEELKINRTFENDIWYVENVSFLLDVKMVFLLIRMVFDSKKRGAQAKGAGISYFVGYDREGVALSLNNYKKMIQEKGEV